MSTVSEKYYDTTSGGKGKMKKAEKITIKVLKVVERIARNEVEKTVLGRTAEVFSDLSPAEKTEEKGKTRSE